MNLTPIIRLQSKEIPEHWELIKFCVEKADEIDEKDLQSHLNDILHSLLNDKSQCWVRLEEDPKRIIGVGITKIIVTQPSGKKSLFFQYLYSFKHIPTSVWSAAWQLGIDFAEKEGCHGIKICTRNKRLQEMAISLGFKEEPRTFEYILGDR